MTAPTLGLDHNERLRPEPALAEALAAFPAEGLARYPDPSRLERAIARRWDVEPDRVLATAGGDDGIDRICRLCLRDRPELLGVDPTFEMIPHFARLAGGVYRGIEDMEDPAPEALLEAVGERTGLVAVITPHNPTGRVVRASRLEALARRLPDPVTLLVDLAYVEFADEDPTRALLGRPDVLLVRTLSKAWGLAGLRVGYVLGTANRIAELRAGGAPFAIAGPSLGVAERAFELGERVTRPYVERVRREREALSAHLRAGGLEPLPSQANFVFARGPDAGRVARRLLDAGIRIRTFPDRPDAVRFTLPGDEEAFDRLTEVLLDVLGRGSPNPTVTEATR